MIKSTRQYRLPSFDEVMSDEPKSKLPSFDEVMGSGEKKSKVGGNVSVNGSGTTATSTSSGEFPLLYDRSKPVSMPALLAGNHPLPQTKVAQPKPQKTIEFTDKDAEQEAANQISSVVREGKTDDPIKESLYAGGDLGENNIKVFTQKLKLLNNAFPTGSDAKEYLNRTLQIDPFNNSVDNVPTEHLMQLAEGNVTKENAVKRLAEQREVQEVLHGRTLDEASLIYAAKSDPSIKRAIDKVGGIGGPTEDKSAIPLSIRGEKKLQFLMNRDVRELAANDPQLKQEYDQEVANFPIRHPEEAVKLLAEEIAKRRDAKGENNWFSNVVGKESTDKIVDEIISDGTFPASYKYITYQKGIRPKLGTWKSIGRGIGNAVPGLNQAVNDAPIPTPGVLENFEQGFENWQVGAAKTLASIKLPGQSTSIIDALQPEEQQNFNTLEKEHSTPYFEPKGTLHKLSMHGGNLGGFVLGLAGTTGALNAAKLLNPEVAQATAMILSTHGDNEQRAKVLFQGDKLKQGVYTGVMDILNGVMGKYLPGQQIPKLLRGGENVIAGTLKKMVDGEITTDAAKGVITNIVANTVKGSLKGGEFMGALAGVDDLLTQTLQGKGIDFGQSVEKGWDAFKIGMLATGPLSLMEAGLKTNKPFRNEIISMSDRPDYYKELATKEAETNPEFAKIKDQVIENIDFVSKVKSEVIGKDWTDNKKKDYIINSLAERVKLSKAEAATDPTIKKQLQKAAKDLHEVKEGALKGIPESKIKENQAIRDVKELYNDGYLSKGANDMLESAEGENAKPKFDEGKVKTFLKFVAEQSNNIDADGNYVFKSNAMKGAKDQYPSQIIDLANEMFPEYAKIREENRLEIPDTTDNEASVIMPEENKSTGDIITIGAKENVPDQKAGVSVILPQSNKAPDIIQLKKSDEVQTQATEVPNETEAAQPDNAAATETKPAAEEGQGEGGEKRTGIKNAVSEATRGVLELPKVDVPKYGSDSIVVQKGKELVDSGTIDPTEVVNRINSTSNHGMNRDEAAAMQYYMHQLGAHETEVRAEIAATDDPITKANYVGLLGQLSDLQDAATAANIKAGKDWSDVGNTRQILIDKSFNASRDKADIKEAYGGEIPKDAKLKIDEALKQRDEAIAARTKVEEQLRQKEAALKAAQMSKEAKKQPKAKGGTFKERVSGLIEELKAANEKQNQFLKDQGIQKSGIGFNLTGEMIKIIGKIGVEVAREGYKTIDELITKVYDQVKDHLPGSTKKDIRDAIAMWEAEKLDTKAGKLEDKITPPLLDKDGKPIEADPKRFEDKPPKLKLKFQTNTDWVKANQRIANAEHKIAVQKRLAYESKKNFFQKGLMWAGRLTRLSILSGVNVLNKLAAAAVIGAGLKRIPEQAIGRVYQTAFKGIAEKAPIEGYINAKSEAKFYVEFFNPKKFVKNSWEILKTGESDLNKRFGGGGYEHVPVLYLPTDLHQIIKDPVKRATFEASFRNSMIWAEKNGLDITDPLVIHSLETAAYKRGNYEIFQESNWLSRKFSQFKTSMEKKGNIGAVGKFIADFMIPVSTVPTNIVRRLVTTSPLGLIRGGKMVTDAYRKGIENLEPEQADAVMKQLKQGSLGTALWLIGWFGAASFGGLYSKYNPNKQRDEGDLASDEMEVGGKMIAKPVQHALPLEIIQWAATARHIYDNYRENKGENTFQSIYNAGMGSIGALAEQIPVIETAAHVAGAFGNPYEAAKLEDDVKRRFQPQILRETGVIKKDEKSSSGGKKQSKSHKVKKQTKQN